MLTTTVQTSGSNAANASREASGITPFEKTRIEQPASRPTLTKSAKFGWIVGSPPSRRSSLIPAFMVKSSQERTSVSSIRHDPLFSIRLRESAAKQNAQSALQQLVMI